MYRVLTCLIDILAAPDGSVIVIDEFENSLGINCMPQLTDFILDKSPNLQFILTSHHPYIINNIPWETWQLVSRTNGTIKSKKATDIPELDTASSLDKFTQLINLLEYDGETA
jgi:predicted ATPase